MNYHHITQNERYQIYCFKKAGWSQKAIVDEPGRSPSTFSREVNGLRRQYVPKRINTTQISDAELAMIEKKLNKRPRKMPGYKTPLEVFNVMAASKGLALRY